MARCDTCQTLDLHSFIHGNEIPTEGLHITTIGKGDRLVKRPRRSATDSTSTSNCELCRFFHALAPTYIRRHELHVRLFDHVKQPRWRVAEEEPLAKAIPKTPFFSVLRKNQRLRYNNEIKDEVIQKGLCVFVSEKRLDNSPIESVAPTVDFDLVGAQLRHCIDTHDNCVQNTRTVAELTQISLIDCEARAVVERSLDEQYLTLSYVWGRGAAYHGSSSAANDEFENAPLTVQDTMSAVRQLGYKYLWVDRFCIDQTESSARAETIANMDLIYERSIATIVALYGDNDQAGLPGVSTTPRTPQMRIGCNGGFLLSSCSPITTEIDLSKWNTRGWTYQEARLSRRCLFFTSTQVYLVCREHTWSEAVPYTPSSNSISALLNSARLDGDLFGRKAISHAISRDRLMYTQRNLTFPGDALNAFRGILGRSEYVTFWGVPVMLRGSHMNPHDSFAMGLLWIKRPKWMKSAHLQAPGTSVARREGFPTWSWASLATEIHQDGYGGQSLYGKYIQGQLVDLPYNTAQIEFSIEINGNFQNLADVIRRNQFAPLPETSMQLLVKGYMVSLRRRVRDQYRWYKVEEDWIFSQPDSAVIETFPGQSNSRDVQDSEDVLILIQWADAQTRNKVRFVLMLLDWIADNRAERKQLLTEYRHESSIQWVRSLPRVYKEFILQ